jgi:hypothetical protein
MHRAALYGLNMVGNKLSSKEEEAYNKKETHKPRSPCRHNSPWNRSSSQRSQSPSPKHHGGTRKSQSPNRRHGYEDDEKEMGASCFTRRVLTTPVPKGFKLPHDQQKYDGSQEPQSWLADYLQVVQTSRVARAFVRLGLLLVTAQLIIEFILYFIHFVSLFYLYFYRSLAKY